MSSIIRNKKAYHDYFILEQIEAGLVLAGSEVKSLRNGRANLKDSFVRIINNEAFVFGMHLTYHHTTNPYFKPDESVQESCFYIKSKLINSLGKLVKRD